MIRFIYIYTYIYIYIQTHTCIYIHISNGATIGGPESVSVTDIFGPIFIDPIAKAGGPFIPSDWKRYRDDTWDIEENVEGEQLEEFPRYLNSEVLRDEIKFTVESSGSHVVFLDTKVHLREAFLVPEIYSKPTDSHEYLTQPQHTLHKCQETIPIRLLLE